MFFFLARARFCFCLICVCVCVCVCRFMFVLPGLCAVRAVMFALFVRGSCCGFAVRGSCYMCFSIDFCEVHVVCVCVCVRVCVDDARFTLCLFLVFCAACGFGIFFLRFMLFVCLTRARFVLCFLFLARALAPTHTHMHSHSRPHSHTHSYSRSHSLSLALAHILTHALTLTHYTPDVPYSH